MRPSSVRHAIVASAVGVAVSSSAVAQSPACTYERCALRVEASPNVPLQSRLVQGIEAKPIADIGFSIPRIPLFEASPDTIRAPYLVFRERQQGTRVLAGLGLGAMLVSGVVLTTGHATQLQTAIPLLAVGAGIAVSAVVEGTRAASALQTAVDRYNATLPSGR